MKFKRTGVVRSPAFIDDAADEIREYAAVGQSAGESSEHSKSSDFESHVDSG
jgi:hypothetical protein